ncbi:MAG: M23 family metallopeptidase [Clostridia bacterium]|nr:M23 family metallopeptidase [Clostridia bacterium]
MKKSNGKVITFIKRNALYLILAFCILAIGLSITLALISKNAEMNTGNLNDDKPVVETPIDPPEDDNTAQNPDDTPVQNPDDTPDVPVSTPVQFIMPVANATSIGEYSEQMVFNSTLNRFTAHMAIDFYASEGTEVMAVYDGTIESVENTLLHGTTITVDHGNGLKTVYNSLADGDTVKVGQSVTQGQVIGQVSVTNRQEYKDGAHLHFQVIEDGEIIDPAKYLDIAEK